MTFYNSIPIKYETTESWIVVYKDLLIQSAYLLRYLLSHFATGEEVSLPYAQFILRACPAPLYFKGL